MKVRNRLKELLQELGIKSLIPTDDLLSKTLDGMTIHRFNRIYNNDSATELTMHEATCLKRWLATATNQSESSIALLESEKEAVG